MNINELKMVIKNIFKQIDSKDEGWKRIAGYILENFEEKKNVKKNYINKGDIISRDLEQEAWDRGFKQGRTLFEEEQKKKASDVTIKSRIEDNDLLNRIEELLEIEANWKGKNDTSWIEDYGKTVVLKPKATKKEVKLPDEFQYNYSNKRTSMEQLGDKINELIDYLKEKGV